MGNYISRGDVSNWPEGEAASVLADTDYSQENLGLRWNGMDAGCLRAFFFNGGFSDEMGHEVGVDMDVDYVQGKEGYDQAAQSNGNTSVLNAKRDADIDSLTKFSIAFLMKPASDGENNEGRVLDKSALLILVREEAGSFVKLHAQVNYDGTNALSISECMVPLSKWSDIGITYDGDGDRKIHIYLNGGEVAYDTQTASIGVRTSDAANSLFLLNRAAGDRCFDGMIDRLHLYNRVLILTEIKWLAQNGLAALWNFQDTCDDSLGIHHGNPTKVTYVAGERGQAAAFLQIDSVVNVGRTPVLQNLKRFGIRVRVMIPAKPAAAEGKLLWKYHGGTEGWYLRLNFAAGNVTIQGNVEAATTDALSISSTTISYGVWYNIAFSYDDYGDRKVHLWIDGTEVAYDTQNAAVGNLGSDVNEELLIGNDDGFTRSVQGYLERVAFYNRPLVTAELTGPELLMWRRGTRPVLSVSGGAWDAQYLRDPILLTDENGDVVLVKGQYVMYYTGKGTSGARAIGRAVSDDGISWTKSPATAVLTVGAGAEWDDTDVHMGSAILMNDGTYRLYYGGYDTGPAFGLGLATSPDGITFTKHGSNPIALGTSWTSDNNVLAVPFVTILSTGVWKLMFEGNSVFKCYLGTSADGITWAAANSGNAVLDATAGEWDSNGVANPKLYELVPNKYLLGYNGQAGSAQWNIGFAYSTDLINWTKFGGNPVMLRGPAEWELARIENAFIAKQDVGTDTVRMWWFGGSDATYFRIGYATCPQTSLDVFSLIDVSGWQKHIEPDLADGHSVLLAENGDADQVFYRRVTLEESIHDLSFLASIGGAVSSDDLEPYAAVEGASDGNGITSPTFTAQGDGSYQCAGSFAAIPGTWLLGAEVKALCAISISLPQCERQSSGLSEAQKDAIIDEIEEWIEELTHDVFRQLDSQVIYFNGNGSPVLTGFPYDILEVTEVVIGTATLGEVTLPTSQYEYDKQAIYRVPVSMGEDDLVEPSARERQPVFPEGYKNIKVTVVMGQATCPLNVKRAIVILVEHRNDPALHRDTGFSSEKVGGHYSHGAPESGQPGSITGVIDADKLLIRGNHIRKRVRVSAI